MELINQLDKSECSKRRRDQDDREDKIAERLPELPFISGNGICGHGGKIHIQKSSAGSDNERILKRDPQVVVTLFEYVYVVEKVLPGIRYLDGHSGVNRLSYGSGPQILEHNDKRHQSNIRNKKKRQINDDLNGNIFLAYIKFSQ